MERKNGDKVQPVSFKVMDEKLERGLRYLLAVCPEALLSLGKDHYFIVDMRAIYEKAKRNPSLLAGFSQACQGTGGRD